MTITLVANKIDLEEKRVISKEEAQEFATRNGLLYCETSAKSGFGVDNSFVETTKNICKKIEDGLDLTNE
jgi:Ras-related protein Rab-2A